MFVDTFINTVTYIMHMLSCPVCGKWFSLQFAMLGHLRLCTDDRHVAYTGKITSRKQVGVASTNRSQQTDSALWEAIFRFDAKIDTLNKTQQQLVTKLETLAISANPSTQNNNAILDAIYLLITKVDMLTKPQQPLLIKTDIPVVQKPKNLTWWEYTDTKKSSKSRSVFAPSDEYLNSLVEGGFSPDFVRARATGKYYKSDSDEDDK